MSGVDTIVGSGSYMPNDSYLKKIETTKLFEPENQIEDYQRQTLKDLSCDAPFFESDQPRRGFESKGHLSLRHSGKRSEAEPWLPDGTFLDFPFVEKDPRGNALNPDMREHVKQQKARGKFYNYRSDADNSVPESGIHPSHMSKMIRNAQHITKDKLKIFDTSFDGWHNGSSIGKPITQTGAFLQDRDLIVPSLAGATYFNRSSLTDQLSTGAPIGWRKTTDHRFKVSKYGIMRSTTSPYKNDWYKNRANSHIDHDITVSWQGQNLNKATALLMMDLAQKKVTAHQTGLHTVFENSEETQTRTQRIQADDLIEAKYKSKETRSEDAHTGLNGDVKNTNRKHHRDDETLQEKTIINQNIIEFMSSINTRLGPQESKDIRDKIQASADDMGIYAEGRTYNANRELFDNKSKWNSLANHKKGKSKTVIKYKGASLPSGESKMPMLEYEKFTKKSKSTQQRRGNIDNYKIQNTQSTKHDMEFHSEGVFTQHKGPMGSKYMTSYHQRDHAENDINDRTSRL